MERQPGVPIAFIIDTDPLDERDLHRTQRLIQQAVRELWEAGVQVRGGIGMVIDDSRDAVLATLTSKV